MRGWFVALLVLVLIGCSEAPNDAPAASPPPPRLSAPLYYLAQAPNAEMAIHRAAPSGTSLVARVDAHAARLLAAAPEPLVLVADDHEAESLLRWDGARLEAIAPPTSEVRGGDRLGHEVIVAASYGSFSDLYALPLDGGEPRRLTTSDEGCFQPVVSGRQVIHVCSADDGTELYRLTLGEDGSVVDRARLTWSAGDDHDPAVSPSGKRLAWVAWRHGARVLVGRADGRQARLASAPRTGEEVAQSSPRWSPDGRRLAFVEQRGPERSIVVVEEGRAERRFGEQADDPQWSPDGRQIAFVEAQAAGRSRVDVVTIDGGAPHRVAPDAHSPRWR